MTIQPFPVRNRNVRFAVIELFGGDNNLSPYVEEDLSEMVSGAGPDVAVIAIADVFDGPARVIEASAAGLRVLEHLGEIDTGDPGVLARNLARALVSFSNQTRIAIGFWDHGSGTFDEGERTPLRRVFPGARIPRWRLSRSVPSRQLFFSDDALLANFELRAMLHDDQSGGMLTNREAGRMLADAFAQAGRKVPVDLIFSDTCLNGMAEVSHEFEGFARCIVASEELEPGDGWDYFEWFSRIAASPPPDPVAWARSAVEAMEAGYRDRTDQHPVTLAAVRSGAGVAAAFRNLVAAAAPFGRDGFVHLDWARSQSQIFASGYDSYDLLDFARKLIGQPDIPPVAAAAQALADCLGQAIVHSIALGPQVAHANGLAFWFPGSRGSLLKDVATYRDLKFDQATGWSAYLDRYR